tara:strand:+ start:1551 stop:1814 length:264 start_codon:yes stop_codon:yes gene_type:complete
MILGVWQLAYNHYTPRTWSISAYFYDHNHGKPYISRSIAVFCRFFIVATVQNHLISLIEAHRGQVERYCGWVFLGALRLFFHKETKY